MSRRRPEVVLSYLPDGRVAAYVRKLHGGWRRVVLRGDLDVWAGKLGQATTQAEPVVRLACPVLSDESAEQIVPRAGPEISPLAPNGP